MTCAKAKIFRHAILLIFMFFGCASHQSQITAYQKDKSFVHAQLVAGALGICGIISIDQQFDKGECETFAELLHEVLRKTRENLAVAPVQQVVGSIGNPIYDEIMSEYKMYPASVLKSLQKIAFAENDFRYLLLVSIDLNEIRKDQYKEIRPKEVSNTPLIDMDLNMDEEEEIEEETLSVFKTTRTIKISFHIYDLRNAFLVWRCTFEDSGSNSRSIVLDDTGGVVKEITRPLSLGVMQGFYGSALQPEAPKFETLLKRVFFSFADQLP